MSNAPIDPIVSKLAKEACLEVGKDVIIRAKQTNTPVIIFDGKQIQQLSAEECAKFIHASPEALDQTPLRF